MAITSVGFIALIVVPSFDRRFGWSDMRLITLGGDGLVLLGFASVHRVFSENSFTSPTIELASDQRVISTGRCAIIRHPMYAAALQLLLAIPIALGPW